jgi:hypothetical protein
MLTKAGQAGWNSIIPIWNTVVMLKIAGRPWWWVILVIIPLVGIVVWIVLAIDLAQWFGKSDGFAVGVVVLPSIFFLILGFGSAQYVGPAAQAGFRPVRGGRHGPVM